MLALATVAFNHPRAISEQIRLLDKYLRDTHLLTVFDNSTDEEASEEILRICVQSATPHVRMPTRMHHETLNAAARMLPEQAEHIGFLDHDVFPVEPTHLISLIAETGFYGVGQRHPATGHLYLWPGFCFFSRKWLAGRPLDFSGLRDGDKRNDGDTGSSLWPLFVDEEWEKMYRAPHSYGVVRRPDEFGLQSWGYERIGSWIHFSNASKWMAVPDPEERERLLFGLLEDL